LLEMMLIASKQNIFIEKTEETPAIPSGFLDK